FVAKVARNLDMAADEVPGKGDHGGLLVGAAAVSAGLAHRLGSLESLIAELAGPASNTTRKLSMTTGKSTAELQAALAAGADPQTFPTAAAEQVEAAARKAEAVWAERDRTAGIQALAQPGFEAEIQAAIGDGSTAEAAGLVLFK